MARQTVGCMDTIVPKRDPGVKEEGLDDLRSWRTFTIVMSN